MRTTRVLLGGVCAAVIAIGLGVDHASAEESAELKSEVKALKAALDALQKRQAALERKEAAQKQAVDANASVHPIKAPPFATAHPGYLQIPGSNTLLKIGGYVKVDGIYDVKGNGNGPALDVGDIPLQGTPASKRNPNFFATARESRFNITTLTPTEAGELKTFIEGDFYGTGGNALHSNSYGFRLRHAYFEVGPWLAGQNWFTFRDGDTIPETLDFNGPTGITSGRQAVLRYTTALGPGKLALALENPLSDAYGTTGVWPDSTTGINYAPEGVVKWTVDPAWGHFAIAGVVRDIAIDTGGVVASTIGLNAKDSTLGWGVLAGLGINTFGKDRLNIQAVAGEGVGRYFNNAAAPDYAGASVRADGTLRATPAYGLSAGYLHNWNDWIRSTVAYNHISYDNELPLQPLLSFRSVDTAYANVLFNPWVNTTLGLEYSYGHVKKQAFDPATGATGPDGYVHRIQSSAIVSF
jgi:outer membrane murein-binding lipoprotein Lpp